MTPPRVCASRGCATAGRQRVRHACHICDRLHCRECCKRYVSLAANPTQQGANYLFVVLALLHAACCVQRLLREARLLHMNLARLPYTAAVQPPNSTLHNKHVTQCVPAMHASWATLSGIQGERTTCMVPPVVALSCSCMVHSSGVPAWHLKRARWQPRATGAHMCMHACIYACTAHVWPDGQQ